MEFASWIDRKVKLANNFVETGHIMHAVSKKLAEIGWLLFSKTAKLENLLSL